MGTFVNLAGSTFGWWRVVSFAGTNKHKRSVWVCECVCGTKREVIGNNLVRGISASCGCHRSDHTKKRTHGESKTPEFRAWATARGRCRNAQHKGYKNYGGRGITFADEWCGKEGYVKFLAHIGRRPTAEHSLDRIDVNRGYEPGNVRWATRQEQNSNRRSCIYVLVDRKPVTIVEACRQEGIVYSTIKAAIKRGEHPQQAFERLRRKPEVQMTKGFNQAAVKYSSVWSE